MKPFVFFNSILYTQTPLLQFPFQVEFDVAVKVEVRVSLKVELDVAVKAGAHVGY